jgi:hypothetical protein
MQSRQQYGADMSTREEALTLADALDIVAHTSRSMHTLQAASAMLRKQAEMLLFQEEHCAAVHAQQADEIKQLREASDLGEPVAWVDAGHVAEMHAHSKRVGHAVSIIGCTHARSIGKDISLYAQKAKP